MGHPESDRGESTDYSQLPLLRMYENRRKTPRVEFRRPALVTTCERQVLKVSLRNISADGVQLRCDSETARAINPRATAIPADGGPELMMRFELSLDGKQHPFAAVGQVRYMTVLRPGEIAFGLSFKKIRLEAFSPHSF